MLKDPDDGGGADGDDEMDDAAQGAGVLVAEKTIEQQILDAIVDAGAPPGSCLAQCAALRCHLGQQCAKDHAAG